MPGGTTAALQIDFDRTALTGDGVTPIDIVVPTGEIWKLSGIGIRYRALGGGGNRNVRIEFVVDDQPVAGVESAANIASGDDSQFIFGPGMPNSGMQQPGNNGTVTVPLVRFVMKPGDAFRTRVPANGNVLDVIDVTVSYDLKRL